MFAVIFKIPPPLYDAVGCVKYVFMPIGCGTFTEPNK